MGYQSRGAGVTTRPNPIAEYLKMGAVNLAKGKVVRNDSTGHLIESTTLTAGSPYFVTIQALDNSAGTAGGEVIGVVGSGQFVTVQIQAAATTLYPGDAVKSSTTTIGTVAKFVDGTDAEGLKIGTYLRNEGGIFARSTTTPFNESLSVDGDYDPGTAVANEIIEIRIR